MRSQVRGGDNDELCLFFFPLQVGGHVERGKTNTHVDVFEGVADSNSVLAEYYSMFQIILLIV